MNPKSPVFPKTIHYCDWASQPDIHILCSNEWTTPAWGRRNVPDHVEADFYLSDNGKYYTFKKDVVNCSACIVRMNDGNVR